MISLVSTVLNDREGTASFFEQMAAQTRAPEEIVIIDGGSRDGTWELLQEETRRARPWRLIADQDRGCNVARGRNIAITRATYEIIASTDIGCTWDPEWLEELVAPLLADSKIEVVVGSWGVREEELAGPWAKTEYALKGGALQTSSTPQTQATSRSIAYRRAFWQRLGGYPEDLTLAGDDTTFDMLTKYDDAPAASAPTIRCYWHRHHSLKGFLKEQYRYFIGAGEAAIYIRYFILVGARFGLEALGSLIGITLIIFKSTRDWGLVALGIALFSIALRFTRWIPASRKLAAMGVDHPLWRVALFETQSRVQSLRGWFKGWLRGNKSCGDIRRRLASAAQNRPAQ